MRLTAWYAGVLLVSLLLFGFAMWLALYQRLEVDIDARLDQRAQGLKIALMDGRKAEDRQQLRREIREIGEFPDGTITQVRDSTGALLAPAPGQVVFPRSGSGRATVELGGRRFRTSVDPLWYGGERYELLVAASLDEVLGVMTAFRYLLLGLIPAVLAVASLGGYWLSRRALRPVDQITAAARSISVQNLSRRITVPQTGDELQRMSETWNEVLGRLDVAVRHIRQFTADASHELRTPLALIRGTAELALRRDRQPEDYRGFLRDIESEATHMTALTESLLVVARSDAGGFEIAPLETNLSELADAVVSQSKISAAQKGIRLEFQAGPRPAIARVDMAAIRRVLLILLDNSLKHTPPGGAVMVKTDVLADGVEVSVEDTGDGIAADVLPHIFERFYRADSARGSGGGFGLGLSIAQAIAQAHGSEITVTSAFGAGARFGLLLKI